MTNYWDKTGYMRHRFQSSKSSSTSNLASEIYSFSIFSIYFKSSLNLCKNDTPNATFFTCLIKNVCIFLLFFVTLSSDFFLSPEPWGHANRHYIILCSPCLVTWNPNMSCLAFLLTKAFGWVWSLSYITQTSSGLSTIAST